MAITKASRISEINIRYAGDISEVFVKRITTWDDPDDSELPIEKVGSEIYVKQSYNEETEAWEDNDYSSADQVIQDICAAVWTDA